MRAAGLVSAVGMAFLAGAVLFSVSVSLSAGSASAAGESVKVKKPKGRFGQQIVLLDKPLLVPDYIFEEQVADGSREDRAMLDFRGRVVVLNFWATWCGVCAHELPKLDVLAGRLPASGIDILAISIDEEMNVAAGTLKERGHDQLRIFQDSQSVLSALLGVRGVPTTFVVRSDGYAVAMVQGPADWSSPEALDWLRALVPAAESKPLASKSSTAL